MTGGGSEAHADALVKGNTLFPPYPPLTPSQVRNAANTSADNKPGFSEPTDLLNKGACSVECVAAAPPPHTLLPPSPRPRRYETPNPFIHTFTGTMTFMNKKTPLDQSNLLLRGATLRNTNFAIGACLYTGTSTKIMQNSRGSRLKIANIDVTVNTTVYLIMVAQCALSFLTLMGYILFDERKGDQLWYVCNAIAEVNLPANTTNFNNCEWESASDTYGYVMRQWAPSAKRTW